MTYIAETKDNRLVIFGNSGKKYFYIEFTESIETPKIERFDLEREDLLELLERNLDRYCQKGLNVVFEKMSESD